MKRNLAVCLLLCSLAILSCKRNSGDGKKNDTEFRDYHAMNKRPEAELQQLLKENKSKIKDGDLIFRSDDGVESESLRSFSKTDASFSHCGFAFIENGEVYVYNCMAGVENPGEKMLRVSFDSFVNIREKTGFGLFRYDLTEPELKNLQVITKENFAKGLMFDKNFDLKTDDKMYCAEMIDKFIKQATNNRIILPTTKIENFRIRDPKYKGVVLKEFEYSALDNLFLNPYCKELVRISYLVPKDK